MALTISQGVAVSYNAVVADMRKAANQWAESAFVREAERQGLIVMKNLGPQIEFPLDYRRNPGTDFLLTDLTPTALTKTEVLTAAVYNVAELSIPCVWSKKDEVQNPTENQKIALVRSIIENAVNSHDDAIEEAIFATSTDGFLGLQTIVPDSGQGTVGGIDAGTEVWWRNPSVTYIDDTDIEPAMTSAWNSAGKGSGSNTTPTLIVSDGATQALFEGTQQALQRYNDTQEAKAGFKILGFKTARYVYSQYANTRQYFLNPKSFQIIGARGFFRDKGETQEIQNANGYVFKLYSALQSGTGNKSRLALTHL